MAISTPTTWNLWNTGMYKFPSFLSLSPDESIEAVLEDIPFFAVGLLAFGVITFFFAMRRVNLLAAYLHIAVFVAFIGAVFDLSQLLSRGTDQTDDGTGVTTVTPLIIAREICYAISMGLRFLTFWTLVAACPRAERPVLRSGASQSNASFFAYSQDSARALHSAAWRRWGLAGVMLKWLLLGLAVGIMVLQMIWRVVKVDNNYGPVYVTESTTEIVTSAFLILKLLLNVFISPVEPRWKVFRYYLAPIAALLISAGVGVGNLATFAFSESILGRFLQAVEMYILVLFVLIDTFYGLRDLDDLPGPISSADSFQGLPAPRPASTFRVSPFDIPSEEPTFQNTPAGNGGNQRVSVSRRNSSMSRLSTWLGGNRRRASQMSDDKAKLWTHDEAERGQSRNDSIDEKSVYSTQGQSFGYTENDDMPRQLQPGQSPAGTPSAALKALTAPQSALLSTDGRPMSKFSADSEPRKSVEVRTLSPQLESSEESETIGVSRKLPVSPQANISPPRPIQPLTRSNTYKTVASVYSNNDEDDVVSDVPPLPRFGPPVVQQQRHRDTMAPPPRRTTQATVATVDSYYLQSEDGRSGSPAPPTPAPSRPQRSGTILTFNSMYGTDEDAQHVKELMVPPEPSVIRGVDSPVYGLDGIMSSAQAMAKSQVQAQGTRALPGLSRATSRASTIRTRRNTASSLDDLFRQQKELDRSIAALKLLSPKTPDPSASFLPSVTANSSEERLASSTNSSRDRLSRRSSLGGPPGWANNRSRTSLGVGPESSSAKSEFSLSNFPTPPWTKTEFHTATAPTQTAPLQVRLRPRSRLSGGVITAASVDQDEVLLPPPKMPAALAEQPPKGSAPVPTSPITPTLANSLQGRATRLDSSGTQYDVTSFIGDLMVPRKLSEPISISSRSRLPDMSSASESGSIISSGTGVIQTAQPTSASAARPVFININQTKAQGSVTSSYTQTTSSQSRPTMSSKRSSVSEPFLARKVQMNVLPSMAMSGPRGSPAPGGGQTAQGLTMPAKTSAGAFRQKLAISGPRPPPPQDGVSSPAIDAFERPRPPPRIGANAQDSRIPRRTAF